MIALPHVVLDAHHISKYLDGRYIDISFLRHGTPKSLDLDAQICDRIMVEAAGAIARFQSL